MALVLPAGVLYATGLAGFRLVARPLSAARRHARMIVVRGKGTRDGWCLLTTPPVSYCGISRRESKLQEPERPKTPAASKWLFRPSARASHLTRQHFARQDLKELAAADRISTSAWSPACASMRTPIASHPLPRRLLQHTWQTLLSTTDISTDADLQHPFVRGGVPEEPGIADSSSASQKK